MKNITFQKLINYLNRLILWEQSCVLCGTRSIKQLCSECSIDLKITTNLPRCPRCLIYLPPKEIHCRNCEENNFHFERIIAASDYRFPLNHILHQLKYHQKLEYSRVLSILFTDA